MTRFTYSYSEFCQVLLNLLAAGQLTTFCVLGNVVMYFFIDFSSFCVISEPALKFSLVFTFGYVYFPKHRHCFVIAGQK